MGAFDKTIDLVILTHPDEDHYGGLTGVFEMYEVDNFIWTGQENESDDFQRFKELIGEYTKVYAGDKYF
jgi:competence protein ComEC